MRHFKVTSYWNLTSLYLQNRTLIKVNSLVFIARIWVAIALGKIVRSQQLTTNRIKFLLDLIDGNFMIRKKSHYERFIKIVQKRTIMKILRVSTGDMTYFCSVVLPNLFFDQRITSGSPNSSTGKRSKRACEKTLCQKLFRLWING